MTSHDLLSRIQSAAEGSAELDRDVLLACGWTDRGATRIAFRWIDPGGVRHSVNPRPTQSLDDITRMIEAAGMVWVSHDGYAEVGVEIYQPGCPSAIHNDRRLALCIAFLRARATP